MSAVRPSERRIALVSPPATGAESAMQAMQLVESMLWAFQGTMRSAWVTAPTTETADVIVMTSATRDERVQVWQQSGKPIILISAAGEAVPDGANVLVYPFRATQLLQLLNELDARLTAPPVAVEPSAPTVEPTGRAVWSFVEALRTLREVQNSAVWLTALKGQVQLIWLKGDGTEYAADANTLQDIRRGTLAFGALRMRPGLAPPSHRTLRPAAELEWFAGYHASPDLAPWLDPKAAFRISRWPNFGLIRPLPSQIRVTALLASTPLTLEQIARRAEMSRVEAIRTLNALDACNLLIAVDKTGALPTPAPQASASTPQPPGGLSSFLRLVRKRLGLSKGT